MPSRQRYGTALAFSLALPLACLAQTPPSAADIEAYDALFRSVAILDNTGLERALERSGNVDRRDARGRTALHVAAFAANHDAMRKLVAAGANPNAMENDAYDIVTIAAVADDLETLRLALKLGCRADNVTSRYDGTALIAAAHLGHVEVVEALIDAGAPLDHVNNLAWTALIESIVLGDGGPRHTATLRALVKAGADVNLADGRGRSPLQLALSLGYDQMVQALQDAGAK